MGLLWRVNVPHRLRQAMPFMSLRFCRLKLSFSTKHEGAALLLSVMIVGVLGSALLFGSLDYPPSLSKLLGSISIASIILLLAAAPGLCVALLIIDTVYKKARKPGLWASIFWATLISFATGMAYGLFRSLAEGFFIGAIAMPFGAFSGLFFYLIYNPTIAPSKGKDDSLP